jgi:hypothetical protein
VAINKVPIRRRFRDHIGANVPASTCPDFHYKLLTQQFSHLRGHKACDGVSRAASGERDYKADRFRWIPVLGFHGRTYECGGRDRASDHMDGRRFKPSGGYQD